jgi:NADH-quinone oxidoreductase subunit H
LGILNALADVLKLLTKEDIIPEKGDKFLHTLAPLLSVFFALIAFAAIPIGPTVTLFGRAIPLQVANINAGLLMVLALASIGTSGVILAGMVQVVVPPEFVSRHFGRQGGLKAIVIASAAR